MTERILYDYNWYVLIYDHEMNQMALVFLYSDDVIVYNGHVLQTTETYDESIRPCILKLKEENQEKLKSGEATQRRVTIPATHREKRAWRTDTLFNVMQNEKV